jgi:hypothetical protein
MKTSFTFFGIIVCFFVSCNTGSDQNIGSDSGKDISISIDTVQIAPRRSSQVGLYQWNGKEILYVDNLYGFVEGYNPEGEFLGTYLKIMNGPEELPGISQIGIHENGYLVKGEAWNFYLYDNEWNFVKKFFLNTNDGSSVADLMNTPNPKSPLMYELQYYNDQFQFTPEGHFWAKIDTEHPLFNAFTNREFYREAYIIGEVDVETGGLKRLLLNRPKSYENYRFVPYHIFYDYHLSPSGNSWFTFEVDSLIYKYDSKLQQTLTYGRAGIGMKTNYPETDNLEAAFETELYTNSRLRYGYFKDIFVDEEDDLTFRTYRTGSFDPEVYDENQTPLRMQVYKGVELLGDFEVPSRFKVLGKIDKGRYVADGYFDELNENQGFYVLEIKN